MKLLLSLPFLLIYGLVLAVWMIRREQLRRASVLLIVMAAFLYALNLPATIRLLLLAVGAYPPESEPSTLKARGAQAIVVLGGGVYRGAEIGPDTVAGGYSLGRVRYAAGLARLSGLPIAVSGAETEASGMARSLDREFGEPVAWLENHSHTTAENARLSRDLLAKDGIRRIVIVTDVWHMGRAERAFRHFGFEVIAAPTGFPPVGKAWGKPAFWLPMGGLFQHGMFGLSELLGQVQYGLMYPISPAPVPATYPMKEPGNGNPH